MSEYVKRISKANAFPNNIFYLKTICRFFSLTVCIQGRSVSVQIFLFLFVSGRYRSLQGTAHAAIGIELQYRVVCKKIHSVFTL